MPSPVDPTTRRQRSGWEFVDAACTVAPCRWCDTPFEPPPGRRWTALFCSGRCKTAEWRARQGKPEPVDRAPRHCAQCGASLPCDARPDARYCRGPRCRVAAHRARKGT